MSSQPTANKWNPSEKHPAASFPPHLSSLPFPRQYQLNTALSAFLIRSTPQSHPSINLFHPPSAFRTPQNTPRKPPLPTHSTAARPRVTNAWNTLSQAAAWPPTKIPAMAPSVKILALNSAPGSPWAASPRGKLMSTCSISKMARPTWGKESRATAKVRVKGLLPWGLNCFGGITSGLQPANSAPVSFALGVSKTILHIRGSPLPRTRQFSKRLRVSWKEPPEPVSSMPRWENSFLQATLATGYAKMSLRFSRSTLG